MDSIRKILGLKTDRSTVRIDRTIFSGFLIKEIACIHLYAWQVCIHVHNDTAFMCGRLRYFTKFSAIFQYPVVVVALGLQKLGEGGIDVEASQNQSHGRSRARP